MASNLTSTIASLPTPSSLLSRLPMLVQDSIRPVTSRISSSSNDGLWKTALICFGLGYLVLVQTLRFQREKSMRKRFGYPDRASLKNMTVEDAQKIIKRGWKARRDEDTAVMIGEFMVNPPNSVRATTAVARMNWLHSKYIASGKILEADLLYTLSVFITEPVRFNRLFEWRPMNEMEHCAFGVFWKSIGDAMGIRYQGFLSKNEWDDGLDFALDVAQWAKSYEVTAFVPSETSNKPAVALIPMIAYWVPWWGKSFVYECVHVLLGDRVREAFLLPEPGTGAAATVYTSLLLRKLALRHLALPRFTPLRRHNESTDSIDEPLQLSWSYGNYPFYVRPTLWNRWGPGAWAIWLYGGKVPGDQPREYMSRGYKFEDLGPVNCTGKGGDEMKADFERMKTKGMGGCPFG
ncbi:putative ER-bound oxygenase mpaB/mpaB'/Rubber oxygenase catalytic domain-containing protein [Seiridium unicorne]|uniref:ER-bound oxygenase mpaB/mpaB'/Rubber oxygenase catalytic domain-containing protein n=1 Tax=Seiridium unicorne TaxID=138068 RepID=A0ABR2UNX5_9PEZI